MTQTRSPSRYLLGVMRMDVAAELARKALRNDEYTQLELELNMPKRTYKNEFVKYNLTDEQIEDMRTQIADVKNVFGLLVDLIEDGCRVNFKYLEEREACNVILSPIDEHSPNAGLMLSAFHLDASKALFEVWYVHFIVSNRNWSQSDQRRDMFW